MATTGASRNDGFGASGLIGSTRAAEPTFFTTAVVLVTAMVPTGIAALIDQRTWLGVDIWIKPLKFEIALAIYLVSLAFFARYLPSGTVETRWYRVYSGLVAAAVLAEVVWIDGAAELGTASHFNRSPVGNVLYMFMGASAVLLTSASATYAWLIARNTNAALRAVTTEGIVIGLALTFVLTVITAGTMANMAGHEVGGSGSDVGGLMLFGWSRSAGDLRVAHFFATHSMHVLPVLALISAVLFGAARKTPLRIATVAYVGLVTFTFIEALTGNPFLPWSGR